MFLNSDALESNVNHEPLLVDRVQELFDIRIAENGELCVMFGTGVPPPSTLKLPSASNDRLLYMRNGGGS
jgi:hypothetical protein